MRIDKYLWCVRLFKTRSLASQHVRSEKLLMDGLPAKPSREVAVGDTFVVNATAMSNILTYWPFLNRAWAPSWLAIIYAI
jgi:ribosome-associated heat shock protein Hsp15